MYLRELAAAAAFASICLGAAAPAWSDGDSDRGDDAGRHARASLVGGWIVTVVQTNCVTGDVTAGPFKALVVFHDGGTLTEPVASVARTASVGTWSRTGRRTFHADSVFLTFGGGVFTGTQELRRTITLSEDGRSWLANVQTLALDANGGSPVAGCAIGKATRFE